MLKKKIVIIGAGPTGLSLGWHLKQKGVDDFLILEKNSYPGGLSASFKDKQGFTWDLGGHIIHEQNKNFVNFSKKILGKNLVKQRRKAFIYFKGRFIPYPFQNNIAFLPERYKKECLDYLPSQARNTQDERGKQNFRSWITTNFGPGIARHFMIPQNKKSWQYSLDKIGTMWLAKRVGLPPLEKIKKECQRKKPQELNWGPHKNFYYPKTGGIGSLWQRTASQLKNQIKFNHRVTKINLFRKVVSIRPTRKKPDSTIDKKLEYDYLTSTMPLDQMVSTANTPLIIKKTARQLEYNSGLIIGLGFNKKPLINNWHWIYFPDKKYSFFRACLISNFSQNNTPSLNYSSFLVEISRREKRENKKEKREKLINGVSRQIGKIFFNNEKIKPISIFYRHIPYYYPIPTLNRNHVLKKINGYLLNNQVYSFGRFGSWKYEQGNMDDCFKEGKKLIRNFDKKIRPGRIKTHQMKKETKIWLVQAEEHYRDALYLYEGGRYSACVFFCHQALEKILKACVVEFINRVPPKIHQLDRVAKEANLKLPKAWREELAEITRHFWKVRYPDFRKYVYTNKKAAKPTIKKTREIYQWILNKLNQQ